MNKHLAAQAHPTARQMSKRWGSSVVEVEAVEVAGPAEGAGSSGNLAPRIATELHVGRDSVSREHLFASLANPAQHSGDQTFAS